MKHSARWVFEGPICQGVRLGLLQRPDPWADAEETLRENGTLRLQYEVLVDLYKYHLDIAWKAVVWHYSATGALLAYYVSHQPGPSSGPVDVLLLCVALLNAGFAYTYWRADLHMFETIPLLEHIATTRRLPGRPHLEFAIAFLVISAAVATVIAVCNLVIYVVQV